jgi:predicted nucleic acid-binding protein
MAKNRYDFVLDCSITMAWCFEDEGNNDTIAILEILKNSTAIVPSLWALEVANVLLIAKRHKRISEAHSSNFIDFLSVLPIIIDQPISLKAMQHVIDLANQVDLTIYDASYLELAIREKIPLLTLDKAMIRAAKKMDISLQPKI